MSLQYSFWDVVGREKQIGPMFGWLSSVLPCYPTTHGLKTHVHTREVGMLPYIELEQTEHPLSIEQQHGMTIVRFQQISEFMLHNK